MTKLTGIVQRKIKTTALTESIVRQKLKKYIREKRLIWDDAITIKQVFPKTYRNSSKEGYKVRSF